MFKTINKNEGLISLLGLVFTIVTFFLVDYKWWAALVFGVTILLVVLAHIIETRRPGSFADMRGASKILFIDDKNCEIVTSLKRNDFSVRKIDDVDSPATDTDVQWANVIFVDYKGVGKKLFKKKEGLGLANELRRIYRNSKRYIIYSSEQDFDGLVDFPYIRKNASYDEFTSLITSEASKL